MRAELSSAPGECGPPGSGGGVGVGCSVDITSGATVPGTVGITIANARDMVNGCTDMTGRGSASGDGRYRPGETGGVEVQSAGLGGGDAELAARGRARRPDDDVDVAPERGEETEQAFERVLAEVATQ